MMAVSAETCSLITCRKCVLIVTLLLIRVKYTFACLGHFDFIYGFIHFAYGIFNDTVFDYKVSDGRMMGGR
jgi:hypothetical protein